MAEKIFPLSRPITVHGDKGATEMKTITLREPTLDEVTDEGFGMPFRFVEWREGSVVKSETVVNGPILKKWIARMSGLDGGTLSGMHPRDLQAIIQWLGDELRPAGDDGKNSA